MTARVRLLALSLVALLGTGALMSATASATPEVPFWNLAGKRLESKTQKASIENRSGVKTTLRSKIGVTEVEIRCGHGALGEGEIEGSSPGHAGKASGVLELSECKLFAKEGGVFKEQTACEVPALKSVALTGALWLEGKKGTEVATTVVVFEAKESPLAKVLINNLKECAYKGSYGLTGSFAMVLLPQDEEFTFIQWALPEAPVAHVWRPPSEEGEKSVGLSLEGNTASLQGEMKVELESEEAFGGGTAPVPGIEAPFWGVQHKRLYAGEERELESGAIKEPAVLVGKIKGTEVEIRCDKVIIKEGNLLGSNSQSDGGITIKTIEFSECRLFAKEGGKFVEQPTCEVAPFVTGKLTGRLWLEGLKIQRGLKPLLVLESAEAATLAEIKIKSKAGEKCALAEEKYKLEGRLPFRMSPENEEANSLVLSISGSSVELYQPAEQERKIQAKLTHEGEEVQIKLPEVKTQIKGGETFGGGPVGVGSKGNWFVKGSQLKKGAKQAKLQQKGLSIITATILGTNIEVQCNGGASEGATIEGNGERQGQDKERVASTSCHVSKPELKGCAVAEPITTTQLKSYLAVNETLQNSIVDVLEPREGSVFMTLKFLAGCVFAGSYPVSGSVAAEVIPKERESQEDLFAFPKTPISKAKHEGPEVKVGLALGGGATTYKAYYGARLATNEPFGVF